MERITNELDLTFGLTDERIDRTFSTGSILHIYDNSMDPIRILQDVMNRKNAACLIGNDELRHPSGKCDRIFFLSMKIPSLTLFPDVYRLSYS